MIPEVKRIVSKFNRVIRVGIRFGPQDYLSPSILKNVLAHPESLRLGGEKVEATVLFSDIARFTTIAEGMAPEEVANLLNRYFGEMTKIIFEHKGTVQQVHRRWGHGLLGNSGAGFGSCPQCLSCSDLHAEAAQIF